MRRHLAPFLAALLTLAAPSTVDAAAAPLRRTFKSFEVSCSAFHRLCAATAGDVAHEAERQRLVVGRRHGRDETWWIGFDVGPGRLDLGRPLTVTIDEAAPITLAPQSGWRITSHPGFATVADGAAAATLLAAMAKGDRLTLAGSGPDGAATTRVFPLDGLVAAEGWIDERQRRDGAPFRAGPSPLEPIDAATEKRFADWRSGPFPQKLLEAHRALSAKAEKDTRLVECDRPSPSDDDPASVAAGVEALRLDAQRTLFVVACTWHVYQGSNAVFLAEGADLARIAPHPMPVWSGRGVRAGAPYVNESGFDPLFRGLWNHSRGRGADDCGEEQIWRYDGKALRLVEQHGRACPANGRGEADDEGERAEAPNAFPVVWQERAEVR